MKVNITPIAGDPSVRPKPGNATTIFFTLPPDKSILHRILIIGSLTHSQFTIAVPSFASLGHDVLSTVLALEALGVPVDIQNDRIELQGVGLRGFRPPSHKINCANSGTTARLLLGLLAGQQFNAELVGDRSLSSRPMSRLTDVLNNSFGAAISTSAAGSLPAKIEGRALRGAEVILPVASAQMKSAILLCGMLAAGATKVQEPSQSRDHTERMLTAFGYPVEQEDGAVVISGGEDFRLPDDISYQVPGDASSAAFLIAAAILLRKVIRIEQVLLNPTRTRFLEIVTLLGVELEITNIEDVWGEEIGSITVHGDSWQTLSPFELDALDVPLLIDEIPILAILAIFADGESKILGARELRLKESDRLRLLHEQLLAFGVHSQEFEDGITIRGESDRRLRHAQLNHGGDHRLAMAFAIAALFCTEDSMVEEAEVVRISYPEFFSDLQRIAGSDHIQIETRDTQNSEGPSWND